MPRARPASAALVLLSIIGVSACSASDEEADPDVTSASSSPTPTDSNSTSPTPSEEADEDAAPAVPGRLPTGTLVDRLLIKAEKPKKQPLQYPSAAFTDQYVVVTTASSQLRVIDRTTFEEVWSAPIPLQAQRTGACELPELARDATSVSVFVGLQCQQMLTYDLATGQQLLDLEVDELGVSGYGLIEDRLFWSGSRSISTMVEDGVPELYANLDTLGVTSSHEQVVDASGIDDTNVVLLAVSDFNTGDLGSIDRLVGVNVGGEEPVVAFSLALGELGLPGGAPKQLELIDRPGGLFRTQLHNGRWAFGTLDPATGTAAGHLVVLPPFAKRGVPAVLAQYVDVYTMSGNTLLTGLMAEPNSGLTEHLARFDLDRGRETWRSAIPPTKGQSKSGVAVHVIAVGFAADGLHAYGTYGAGASQKDLFEVDLETGEQTGRWPKVDDKVFGGDWYVDGDLVVGVQRVIYLRKEPELVIKQAS
jgi:hypothetical protein